ncbi:MAG: hypothetical protein E6Q97_15145 [Desulfurellales bacterium]|nr:MAG: hypothetical protein E6Q97_15145 [Desulfurellales bacterium]
MPTEILYGGSPVGEYELAWKYGIGDLEVEMSVNGLDFAGVPENLQVAHNENGAITWTAPINDPIGKYHPKRSGTWFGVLDNQAYNSSDELAKTLRATITWGGYPYHLIGVPTHYGHSRAGSPKFQFSWSGIDISSKLYRRAQTMETVRSSRGNVITNKQALAQIFAEYGIRYDLADLKEIPINFQHRQNGRPGDWMQALLDTTMAAWCVEVDTLRCYQPATSGPVKWEYGDEAYLREDQLDANVTEVVNHVVVRRAAEASTAPPQGEPTDTDNNIKMFAFGNSYSQSFNPPLNGIRWEVSGDGLASDFICRNKDGNVFAVIAPRGAALGGLAYPTFLLHAGGAAVNGVASVSWTWGASSPLVPFSVTGAAGQIAFFGNQGHNVSGLITQEYDETYTVESMDSDSINRYGLNKIELRPNPLFARSEDAQWFADEYIRRKAWDSDPQTFRVNLNLALRVGDRVRIIDPLLGNEDRYVDQVTHLISDDSAQRYTRFRTILYGWRP